MKSNTILSRVFSLLIFIWFLLFMSRCGRLTWSNDYNSDNTNSFTSTLIYSAAGTFDEIFSFLGNSDAQLENSMYYYLLRDQVTSLKWLRKSAENGNVEGQYRLCINYFCSFQYDEETALSWCLKSANQGNIQAQAFLSEAYKKMGDVDKSKMWSKAANSGITPKFVPKKLTISNATVEADSCWNKTHKTTDGKE